MDAGQAETAVYFTWNIIHDMIYRTKELDARCFLEVGGKVQPHPNPEDVLDFPLQVRLEERRKPKGEWRGIVLAGE